MTEQAFTFALGGETLLGVLHPGVADATRGVLVVVGGPQYRVGSHRQFLLLARHLAAGGIPVLRFDYRGMGDATGDQRDFEAVNEDIAAAINAFQIRCPGVREVVIWGLCDAASAALIYAWRDPRVTGLVLVNPWVRTEEGLARAYLRQYYLRRPFSRDFWSGLLLGRFHPVRSLRSLAAMVTKVMARRSVIEPVSKRTVDDLGNRPLPERMALGWRRFGGPKLLILSGDDLTAAEFRDVAARFACWQGLMEAPDVTVRELHEANHTFSRSEWRDQVARWTQEWVEALT